MHTPRSDSSTLSRAGFSLLEIIIATAILMGSVGVLARLAGMGRTMAQKADLLSEAQRVCERTMNEIVLGDRPLQFVDRSVLEPFVRTETPAPDLNADGNFQVHTPEQRWLHSVVVTPVPEMPELVQVTVTVEPDTESETDIQTVDVSTGRRRERFTLSRWVRAPANEDGIGSAASGLAGGLR